MIDRPVLERFLRYVAYDTQASEDSTTYPSTPGQLVLLADLAAELKAMGLADAAMDAHGYVMATVPATSPEGRRAGDRLHRPRRHLARDERRERDADRPPRLRRPRPGPARRPRRGAARGRHPLPRRVPRPRHRHRLGHDAARRRQQERRGGDHDRGRVPAGASRDSARTDSHRVHARRGGRPRHHPLRRRPLRRPLRLHDGRRAAGRAGVRELLRRRHHLHLPRLQHPSRVCEGPDGQRDQAGGALHRPAAARSAVAGDDGGSRRASCTPT